MVGSFNGNSYIFSTYSGPESNGSDNPISVSNEVLLIMGGIIVSVAYAVYFDTSQEQKNKTNQHTNANSKHMHEKQQFDQTPWPYVPPPVASVTTVQVVSAPVIMMDNNYNHNHYKHPRGEQTLPSDESVVGEYNRRQAGQTKRMNDAILIR